MLGFDPIILTDPVLATGMDFEDTMGLVCLALSMYVMLAGPVLHFLVHRQRRTWRGAFKRRIKGIFENAGTVDTDSSTKELSDYQPVPLWTGKVKFGIGMFVAIAILINVIPLFVDEFYGIILWPFFMVVPLLGLFAFLYYRCAYQALVSVQQTRDRHAWFVWKTLGRRFFTCQETIDELAELIHDATGEGPGGPGRVKREYPRLERIDKASETATAIFEEQQSEFQRLDSMIEANPELRSSERIEELREEIQQRAPDLRSRLEDLADATGMTVDQIDTPPFNRVRRFIDRLEINREAEGRAERAVKAEERVVEKHSE